MDVVGFIGLGTMGGPMASHLTTDYDLVVLDALPAVTQSVAEQIGARPASSVADLAGASIVVLMLPDSNIVDKIVRGSDDQQGLLDVLSSGSLILDMSSSDPVRTRANADAAAEKGIAFVDAPVSGGKTGAQAGKLSIMVGGSEADVARVRPILELLGARITVVGGVGSGHAVKALNNLLAAANLAATSEVITAGRRFGIEPAVLMDVIMSSSGMSGAAGTLRDHALNGAYDFGFSMPLMAKDVATGRSLIEALDLDLGVTGVVGTLWRSALADPAGYTDMTHIAEYVERHA